MTPTVEPVRGGGVLVRIESQVTPEARPDKESTGNARKQQPGGDNVLDRAAAVGEAELLKAIEKANKALQGPNTSFRFSIHEGTREIMVKVVDNESGEVIREIPPEKILDMVAKIWELAGLFVDERR